jgi:hypothetical protein
MGVSNLLSGNIGALVPEGTPRYKRRNQIDLHVVDAPEDEPDSAQAGLRKPFANGSAKAG